MVNRLSVQRRTQIINCLVEGTDPLNRKNVRYA